MTAPTTGPPAARNENCAQAPLKARAAGPLALLKVVLSLGLCFGLGLPLAGLWGNAPSLADGENLRPILLKFPSAKVQAAFNSEMNFIEKSMLSVFRALIRGNFEKAGKMADNINRGHMLTAELTPAEITLLSNSLPPDFKKLDGNFHAAAARLKKHIVAKDLDKALDAYREANGMCIRCHRQYATHVFPFWKELAN